MKRTLILALSCILGALATSVPDPFDEEIADACGFSSWKGMLRQNYPCPVGELAPPPLDLPTNGLDAVSVCSMKHVQGVRVLSGDHLLADIQMRIAPSPLLAKRMIVEQFSEMSTVFLCTQVTNGIGDVLFHRSQGTSGDFAVFARNNVFVLVDSRMPSCSATNIAQRIDAAILRVSGVPAE